MYCTVANKYIPGLDADIRVTILDQGGIRGQSVFGIPVPAVWLRPLQNLVEHLKGMNLFDHMAEVS